MENPATAGFWLSPQQRLVWSLQQQGYAYRASCLVLIEGAVSADDMGRFMGRLVARHEILRTVYRHQAGMKFPFQVVLESVNPAFEAVDLSALSQSEQCGQLEKFLLDEQVQSVGPEAGPVLTAKFATLGNNRSALVLGVPAMSVDRGSLQVLVRDLEQFARGLLTKHAEEPLRYIQFAQWQNDLPPSPLHLGRVRPLRENESRHRIEIRQAQFSRSDQLCRAIRHIRAHRKRRQL